MKGPRPSLFVMVGLDPTIQKPLKLMDPRVKPKDDGSGHGKIVINICLRKESLPRAFLSSQIDSSGW